MVTTNFGQLAPTHQTGKLSGIYNGNVSEPGTHVCNFDLKYSMVKVAYTASQVQRHAHYICKNALDAIQNLPSPAEHGWQVKNETL